MMESINLRYVRINIVFVVFTLILFSSCQEKIERGKLECILDSIEVNTEGIDILVGQHDGWTDSTMLITIIFEDKSMNISKSSSLKGKYKENDIYFNQGKIDTLDAREYEQIANNIKWHSFVGEIIDDGVIHPPYDPIGIQVEYNIKRNCVSNIIKGKGYVMKDIISRCDCKNHGN